MSSGSQKLKHTALGGETSNIQKLLYWGLLLTVGSSLLSFDIFVASVPINTHLVLLLSLVVLAIAGHVLGSFNFKIRFGTIMAIIFLSIAVLEGFLVFLSVGFGISQLVRSCMMPIIVLLLAGILPSSLEDIEIGMICFMFSILLFFGITLLAPKLGIGNELAHSVKVGQLAVSVNLGRIHYVAWGNWIGAAAAILFPSFLMVALTSNTLIFRIFGWTGLSIISYMALRSGTRGGVFGCAISISVVVVLGLLLLRMRFRFVRRLAISVIVLMAFFIVRPVNITKNVQDKFSQVSKYGLKADTIAYRIDLMKMVYKNFTTGKGVIGFDTLWKKYGIDEASFWVWLMNGVGLRGILGYAGGFLLTGLLMFRGLNNFNYRVRALSIVGVATWLAVVFSSNSSDQILHQAGTAIPYWLLVGLVLRSNEITILNESHA